MLIGIDGLPLFQSSSKEFWPILGLVTNVKSVKSSIFSIGVYCGKGKPDSADSYMLEFVLELKKLISEGFYWKDRIIPVFLKGFLMDAPAKSFILK